jgi:hypothetical protein
MLCDFKESPYNEKNQTFLSIPSLFSIHKITSYAGRVQRFLQLGYANPVMVA